MKLAKLAVAEVGGDVDAGTQVAGCVGPVADATKRLLTSADRLGRTRRIAKRSIF